MGTPPPAASPSPCFPATEAPVTGGNDSVTTNVDVAVNETLPGGATDADGDPLTYAIVGGGPAHGTISNFNAATGPSPTPRRPTTTAPTASPTWPTTAPSTANTATVTITVNRGQRRAGRRNDSDSTDEDIAVTTTPWRAAPTPTATR